MRTRLASRRRLGVAGAGLLLALAPILTASTTGPAAPRASSSQVAPLSLSLEDLSILLESRVGSSVIVRQIRRSGIDFPGNVNDLLRLKSAGADDAILEAVIEAAEDSAGNRPADRRERLLGSDSDQFRIYESHDSRGQPVMVLTNLDDQGRRIGGEVDHPTLANIVSSRTEGASADRRHRGSHPRKAQEPASPPAQVIVIKEEAPPPPPAPACGNYDGCTQIGLGCNVVATGGVVGAYKYPDKLWFLGYAPGKGPINPSFDARGNVRIGGQDTPGQ